MLTLAAFNALGGVGGVMANRGEEVYGAVDDKAREAFHGSCALWTTNRN